MNQEKKAGRSRRGQSPAQDSLSGNKDSAKAERLPAPRLHGTACRKKAPARMRTIWPCRRPRKPGPLAIARSFCTSPCGRHGNGRWAQPVCRTKGALGGTAGTALASGAHRMAVAEESTEHIHAFHQGLPRVSLPVTTAGSGRRVMRQGKRGIAEPECRFVDVLTGHFPGQLGER